MKKVALTLASVIAAAAFAPEASAIPAFARQTGMACSSCHFQHYPVLAPFGQAFKAGGFTMVGSQGLVEGEHLSLPNTLNGAILLKSRFQKSSGSDVAGTVSGTTTNGGQWQIPDEFSLFFGGRVADAGNLKIGFMNENNLVGGPVGGIVAGLRVPIVYDLGAVTVSAIPYLTDSLGMAYGYEQSSTGMTRGIRWAEHRKDISAAQYTGLGNGAASGLAIVVRNDMGYINVSRYAPNFAYAGGANAVQMGSTWLRVAATPTVADWNLHVGFGMASGSNYCNANLTVATAADECVTKGTALDLQAQGKVAGMDTSVYATYASVPASGTTAGSKNAYNGKATDVTAITVGADVSVIEHTLHVGGAFRMANTGMTAAQQAAGAGDKDNSITVTAVYDLVQNVAVHVNHSIASGSAYDATGTNAGATLAGGSGKSLTTFLLEAAW